jgi:polyhydroxyalkanoate synthesis regulator phasin
MNSGSKNKQRRGGVLKVILIIMGSLALLFVVGAVGIGFYTKKKIDEAGGIQGFASKMMAKGIDALKPELEKVLSANDIQRLNQDITALKEQATNLSQAQIEAVANSLQKLAEKMQSGALTEADAKTFVDELSAVLKEPAPAAVE